MILTVTPPLHSNCQEGGVILKLSSLDIGGVQKAIRARDAELLNENWIGRWSMICYGKVCTCHNRLPGQPVAQYKSTGVLLQLCVSHDLTEQCSH